MNDPYNLQRFVDAQNPVFDEVCDELRAGCKRTHWMWFIFPQLRGLGRTLMAKTYAISSREEAAAYFKHEILGPRIVKCTELITAVTGRTIDEILGHPDDLKFRSSMILFAHATSQNKVFIKALHKYFAGEFDPLTVARL